MDREQLRARLQELAQHNEQMLAAAEREGRDLTEEEERQFGANEEEFERAQKKLSLAERAASQSARLTQGQGRQTAPNQQSLHATAAGYDRGQSSQVVTPGHRPLTVPAQARQEDGMSGFHSLGEFAKAVYLAGRRGSAESQWDPRLRQLATPTTYANEADGAYGGILVPTDIRTEIMAKVTGEETLISRCQQITTAGNAVTIPVDDTTPWGSTGVLAYWENEGALKTQSRPVFDQRTVRLNKVIALVPVTDELLEDAPALDTYLRRVLVERIGWKVNMAIIGGTGAGQPLGILNASSIVSVAKETSQVADTFVAANAMKVYSRMYAPCRSRAVWLYNQDMEPQLFKLSMPGTDNTGAAVTGWGIPVWQPANGFSGSPYATLFGRPMIPTQACETLGDKGDIIFVDLSQYLVLLKGGTNPRVDISMHLWFDYDISAFRAVLRMGGFPWWGSAITPRDGSASLSWAVTLDERA